MRLALFFAFIALPLMEIALLIKAGQTIGFWPTLAIIVATAIGGSEVIRRQGYATMTEMSQMFEGGRMPLEPVLNRMFLLLAGTLLIAPGLLTDALGLILLVPPVRYLAGKWLAARFFSPAGTAGTSQESGPGQVIEGEFQRIDEHDPEVRPPTRL